jgi:hypothetical protein
MGRVDQTLLTAAILNLALNARNAMPNGGTHETRVKLTLWGRP